GDDVIRVAALLRPARGRDDAVGAELVAPDLDADVGLERCRTHGGVAGRVEALEAGRDRILARVRPAQAQRVLRLARLLDRRNPLPRARPVARTNAHIGQPGPAADPPPRP